MSSGWCSDYQGVCSSEGLHAKCQERLEKGLLASCDCTVGGGHVMPESLSTVGDATPAEGLSDAV